MASPQRGSAPESSYPSMTHLEKILLIRRVAHQTASTAELVRFRARCSHDPEFRAYLTDTKIQPALHLTRGEISLCLELARYQINHPDDYGTHSMEEAMVGERAERAARQEKGAEAVRAAKATGEDQHSVPRLSKHGLFRKRGGDQDVRSSMERSSSGESEAAEAGRREDLNIGQVTLVGRFGGLGLVRGAAGEDQSGACGEGEIIPRGTGGIQPVPFSRQATPVRKARDLESIQIEVPSSARAQGEIMPRGAEGGQPVPFSRQVTPIRRGGVIETIQRGQGASPRRTGQGGQGQIPASYQDRAEGSGPRPDQGSPDRRSEIQPAPSRSEIQPASRRPEIQPAPIRARPTNLTTIPGQVRRRGGSRSPPKPNPTPTQPPNRSSTTPPTQPPPMTRTSPRNSPVRSALSPFAQVQVQAPNPAPSTAPSADLYDPFTDPEALICDCNPFSCSCFGERCAFRWNMTGNPRNTPSSTAAASREGSANQLEEIVVVPATSRLEEERKGGAGG